MRNQLSTQSGSNMEFRQDQWKLIHTAVRRYQIERCINDSPEYWECSTILDELFDEVYTQNKEQPT
jgi:hypothetical protein